MKRIFFLILFLLLTVQPALATINYCKWDTGDDTTGTGTTGNPYKTIQKCTNGLTGGDECRVSESGAHTALSGTLTFTDGSTTVSTSVDLTSSVSAEDMIGKDADDGLWWEVSSINSTTITLTQQYSGTSEAVSGYKLTAFDMGDLAYLGIGDYVDSDGTSNSSRIVISGGWDLSGPTQDGVTYFIQTGSATEGYGLVLDGDDYITVEDLHYTRFLNGIEVDDCTDVILDGMTFGSCSTGVNITAYAADGPLIVKNIKTSQAGKGIYSLSVGTFQNIVMRSCSLDAFDLSAVSQNHRYVVIDNVSIYNTAGVRTLLDLGGYITYFIKDATLDGCQAATCYGISLTHHSMVYMNNVSMNDLGYSFYNVSAEIGHVFAYDHSQANINETDGHGVFSFSQKGSLQKTPLLQTFETAGEQLSWGIISNGLVYELSAANARSGAAALQLEQPANYTGDDYGFLFLGQKEIKETDEKKDFHCSVYAKADSAFTSDNGDIAMAVIQGGRLLTDWETNATLSTSYAQFKVAADKDDMSFWPLECWARIVNGYTGKIYLDDFSAWQQ